MPKLSEKTNTNSAIPYIFKNAQVNRTLNRQTSNLTRRAKQSPSINDAIVPTRIKGQEKPLMISFNDSRC